MFPIYNNSNEPVAFTARIFEGIMPLKTIKNIDETGKYVNSPQTKVYEKGKILYGLNITKRYISQQNEAIVVEGTMDFLSAYLKGNKNIVASLGTALTLDQLTLLKRLCSNLILAYDNDEAGKMATERNIKLALSLGFQLKILDLEDSKDISDFINDHPEDLDKKIKNSLPVMDFYIKHGLSLFNTNLLNGKNDFLKYFLPKLKWEKDIIKISHYLNRLVNTIDVKLEALEETFKTIVSEEIEDESFRKIKENLKPQNLDLLKSKSETLSEAILSIFVQKPIVLKTLVIENSEFFNFNYQDFLNLIKQNGIEIINDQTIDPAIKETIDYLFLISPKYENLINHDDTTIINEINNYLILLKQEHFKSRMVALQNEIKTAESKNDMNLVNELINELNTICTNLNKLN